MKPFIKVMKALSDPSRVKIVKALQHRSLCVCELKEALGLAQSTVSKHLKVLEEAGLVSYEKDGLWVNFQLNGRPDNTYAREMLAQVNEWLEADEDIREMLDRLPGIDREFITRG
ncbi:metalloregulator ArsR/SmtB family transcription factor [Desulfoluna sp.]|uniref:ArsR/SmtB family transcription factor n=1 Tax=Desulfoluna sp. TaxID=2045199 RepID=UPI002622713C|nr:metalloregulator ArsR/SmtB family transcription factor [Desulfoluna sp.]